MRLIEKIIVAVIIVGITFKLLVLPGGNFLATMGFNLLATLYFILGFALFNQIRLRDVFKKNTYKDISPVKIVYAVLLGLFISLMIVGINFKLNHWEGANDNLITGLVPTVILVIIGFIQFKKLKEKAYLNGLKRGAIIGIIGLFMYLSSELMIEKIIYRNHPGYIEAYQQYLKNPEDETLRAKKEMEYNRIIMEPEHFKRRYPDE